MVYNGYYKVMSNIPKMGHLPIPVNEKEFPPEIRLGLQSFDLASRHRIARSGQSLPNLLSQFSQRPNWPAGVNFDVENPWKTHGKPMENPWKTHEKPWKAMENPWKTHGKPMEKHENPWFPGKMIYK